MKDSDRLFLLLKGPEHYAHMSAKEMLLVLNSGKRLRTRAMLKLADQHFFIIMNLFSVAQNAEIIKTWLSVYELPFNPEKLKSFDAFHASHGDYIIENCQELKGYV